MTVDETNELEVNSAFSGGDWNTLKSSLLSHPYSSLLDPNGEPGLLQYNWRVKTNKNDLGTPETEDCPASGAIISPCQFAVDVDALLAEMVTTEEIQVEVQVPEVEIVYIDGEVLEEEFIDNSWTMSYSLKDKSWISWYLYLPSTTFMTKKSFSLGKKESVNSGSTIEKDTIKLSWKTFSFHVRVCR